MKPLKPYLIRAVHEWIVDHGLTPYLLVDAEQEGVIVPPNYVQDGQIVLNLRPEAIHGLSLGDGHITFRARFGGIPTAVEIPVRAVHALYAKENGRGMVFQNEEDGETPPPEAESRTADKPAKPSRPVLRIVK
jgi:stringent starvation protein B